MMIDYNHSENDIDDDEKHDSDDDLHDSDDDDDLDIVEIVIM